MKVIKIERGFRQTCVWVAFMVIGATAAWSQVQLITEEEAKLPEAKVPATRAITRGPSIKLNSPSEVTAGSFPLDIRFEARGGAKINFQTLKVEYLKDPLIDITTRIKSSLQGDMLEISKAKLPVGQHKFRVSVEDSEGRTANQLIQIRAK